MGTGMVYNYDSLGRLTNVTFNDGAMVTYNYDQEGNRTSVVQVAAGVTVAALPKRLYGDFSSNPMVVLLSTGQLVGWGDNTTGALANGQPPPVSPNYSLTQRVTFDPNTTVPPSSATVVDWAFTGGNLFVVFSNGWVYSAGVNSYGQLGHGDTTARPWLKRIEYFVTNTITVTKVWSGASRSASGNGGCVFFLSSTNNLYACGLNTAGNLGNATTPTSNVSTPAPCAGVPTTPNVVDVQMSSNATNFSTFLVMSDGTVLVAGYNANGQLGTGNTTNVTGAFVNAKQTGNTNITTCAFLRANGNSTTGCYTMIVDTSGNVWGTGFNGTGELGLGNTTNQTLFTQATALSNITDLGVTGAPGYGYAINSSGTLFTWGYNAANNQFRNSTTSPITTPSTPPYTPGAIAKVFLPRGETLAANAQMSVLTTTGKLAFAGAAEGQLAIANTVTPGAYSYIPTPLEFLNGTETIAELFVHGTQATQRWFILSNLGNLYACGSNVGGICTGGISSGTAPPPYVAFQKISNF
jgi:YD repeat-containing protein